MLIEIYCAFNPNPTDTSFFCGKFRIKNVEAIDWAYMREVCLKATRDRTKFTEIVEIEVYDTQCNLLKTWKK